MRGWGRGRGRGRGRVGIGRRVVWAYGLAGPIPCLFYAPFHFTTPCPAPRQGEDLIAATIFRVARGPEIPASVITVRAD